MMKEEDSPVNMDTPEVKEKLNKLTELLKTQVSEENKTEELPQETNIPAPSPIKGSDVNWDDYELESDFAHFYPHAELIQQGEEFKWVVLVSEFHSFSLPYNGKGLDEKGRPKGFAGMLTFLVNGPEKWRIVQVIPNGSGLGAALLQRQVPITLPDPVPVKTEASEIEKMTDEELLSEEAKADEWIRKADEAVKQITSEENNGVSEVSNTTGTEQSV